MDFVTFEEGRNGSVLTTIDRRVSFPERGGSQPKVGELWYVKIAGRNDRETVNFLKMIAGPLKNPEGISFSEGSPKRAGQRRHLVDEVILEDGTILLGFRQFGKVRSVYDGWQMAIIDGTIRTIGRHSIQVKNGTAEEVDLKKIFNEWKHSYFDRLHDA